MAPQAKSKFRAPKFNAAHLDPHRARKLKKDWLATQKIKASYRAEKRRTGLGSATALNIGTVEDDGADTKGDATDAQLPDDASSDLASDRLSLGGDQSSHSHLIAERSQSARNGKGFGAARSNRKEKQTASPQPAPTSTPSLREMAREAYSPASLHTHKSNPLHRRQQGNDYARRRVEAAGRGASSAWGGPAKGGRGQPDMAKRMGVLLEKIKRTT